MSGDYREFVANKLTHTPPSGITDVRPEHMPETLYPHQRDLTAWALRRGRAALFADTGLGKTAMQLEWAARVHEHTGENVIILAPLAVAAQTVAEGERMGITVTEARDGADVRDGITITNYERLHRFDTRAFGGVVLDESSIIKHHDAKTLARLMEAFGQTPWKLCATATPAPNDYTELGTHAEFLGICSRTEMLSEYFTHDGGETQVWRLKGHARAEYWRWVASWAALVQKPSDLGHCDAGYTLPPYVTHQHIIPADPDEVAATGRLFAEPAQALMERRKARRASIGGRVAAVAEVVNADHQPWIVWCDLNAESEALVAAIPGAVEVRGSQSIEFKEMAAAWFAGNECVCAEPMFRAKLSEWETLNAQTRTTCANTTSPISTAGASARRNNSLPTTPIGELGTPPARRSEAEQSQRLSDGEQKIQTHTLLQESASMGSLPRSTVPSSLGKAEDVPFALPHSAQIGTPAAASTEDSTSTTATNQGESAESSVPNATWESGNSVTIRTGSSVPLCICGHKSGRRVLVSKASIFGFGLNWQHCARMAFVGVTDSWEAYYQAVRRCWRFGQKREVHIHVFSSELEGAVVSNLARKEKDAQIMARELSEMTAAAVCESVTGQIRSTNEYAPKVRMEVPTWMS